MTRHDVPLAALTAIRDAGLTVDRDALNLAWSELHGRTATVHGRAQSCQHRGCHLAGMAWLEPAGVWCSEHRPQLWRDPTGNAWATPRCRCGAPGRYPTARFGVDACCRDHAPRRMTRYLVTATVPKEIPA